MAKLRPIGNNVIIEREEAESVTKGGIHLPDSAKDKPARGKVLAVGPGRMVEATGERTPIDLNEGDIVLFNKWADNEIEFNGKMLCVIEAESIVGVVN